MVHFSKMEEDGLEKVLACVCANFVNQRVFDQQKSLKEEIFLCIAAPLPRSHLQTLRDKHALLLGQGGSLKWMKVRTKKLLFFRNFFFFFWQHRIHVVYGRGKLRNGTMM